VAGLLLLSLTTAVRASLKAKVAMLGEDNWIGKKSREEVKDRGIEYL